MKQSIKQIVKRLHDEFHLDTSHYKDDFVEQIILKNISIIKELFKESKPEAIEGKQQNVEKIVAKLQNNYTDFFRNPFTYAVLSNVVFPTLFFNANFPSNKEIRVWSAACASGLEAFSLAIILEEFFKRHLLSPRYRIFATDRSNMIINQAKKAAFSHDELKSLSKEQVELGFDLKESNYCIKPSIQTKISFSTFDLISEKTNCPSVSIYGDFQIIMIANLLFYYKSSIQKKIINRVLQCMSKDSYLISGETEREILMAASLVEIVPNSCVFQMKPA